MLIQPTRDFLLGLAAKPTVALKEDGFRSEAEQESCGNRATHLPRRKAGVHRSHHEPVIAGKALQSVEKFEAAEAWTPAFATELTSVL